MKPADLPRDLEPWRPELGIFPAELAVSLAGPLRRLRNLFGPLSSSTVGGGGEPDGYQDLARRGPYERLIASEWLLAEEAPEEFDRRAAMGEHLFVELAHRSPRPTGRTVALFDAGPEQLGGPRIVQLAALVLLAGRARSAGVELRWGLVQAPGLGARREVSEDSVLRFLAGRSAERATGEDLEDWRQHLGDPQQPDDLWLVGSERLTRLAHPGPATLLTIVETFAPGERSLEVCLARPRQRPRTAVVELPPEPAAIRLLRDPFAVEVAAPTTGSCEIDPTGGLIFGDRGLRLLTRGRHGEVLALHVPGSPRAQPGKTRRFVPAAGEETVAAGFIGRAFVTATLAGSRLTVGTRLWGTSERMTVDLPPDLTPVRAGKQGPFGLCAFRRPFRSGPAAAVVIDRQGRALEVSARRLAPLGESCGRVAAADGSLAGLLVVAELLGGGPRWGAFFWGEHSDLGMRASGSFATSSLAAVFGYGEEAYAVGVHPERWLVVVGQHQRELGPGRDAVPVAVVAAGADSGLVVLEDDRRTFSQVSLREAHILTRAGHPVESAVGCRAQPVFAYLTTAGELTVFSLAHRAPVLKVMQQEDA